MKVGFFLMAEEYGPRDLVRAAKLAEQAGFESLWISDHFHPWNDAQGQSPFVWSVIGALSQATSLPVTTAVTCPTTRLHPVIVAQAAATSAELLDGRFSLGVGTGEALNEHVTGARWPAFDVRADMLAEAVGVIRKLWTGEVVDHHGRHYEVENARIYTLPDPPPSILVSGLGPQSARLAGEIGDGLITTRPDPEGIATFHDHGGDGKPVHAGYKVCWTHDADLAVRTVHELWPTSALPGELGQVLPTPAHFEQATQLVTPEAAKESTVCGDDVDTHVESLAAYRDAGVDAVHVGQIGGARRATSLEGFFDFYASYVLPRFRALDGAA